MRYESDGRVWFDGGAEDWERILGETWDSYVDPIEKLFYHARQKKSEADRNDILRPWFNTLARPDGHSLVVSGVQKFYSDPDGLYCRMMAYETGRDAYIENRKTGGAGICNQPEYQFCINEMMQRQTQTKKTPHVLDHGAGAGNTTVGILARNLNITAYDYYTPHKKMLTLSIGKYGPLFDLAPEKYRFIDAAVCKVDECGKFDLVISQDVMEHLIDPLDEVKRVHSVLNDDGLLLMGTFFNSCNGNDPQHLTEHDKYQDWEMWFREVEEVGFVKCCTDGNGVNKVWRKKKCQTEI